MPIALIVNGNTYNYPVAGEDPQWGDEASAWAEAVTDTLASLAGSDDILTTDATISNNISVETDVNGLLFNTATIRSAVINYAIRRTSTLNPSGVIENGLIELVYDNNASSGNKWLMTIHSNGNAQVSLSITDAGQVQYKSSDIDSAGYNGTITFNAKVFNQ